MTDPNFILSEIIKHSDKVKRISEPLKENFGIKYFYHYRIYNDGNFIFLSNRPDIEEHWLNEKVFLVDPFVKHPANYTNGFFFMETYTFGNTKNALDRIVSTFNLCPWLCMTEKNTDSFDFLGFWGDILSEYNLKRLQINNASIFKAFSIYFKNESKSLAYQMEESSHSMIDLVGKDSFYSDLDMIPTIEKDCKRRFLSQIRLNHKIRQADSLSKREMQCVKALILGKSAKDIAIELRLSYRTVEHYLENARNKLGCCSKSDLISIFRELDDLGLLDS